MAADRLSQDEVALVLRRAAELDPETTTPAEEGLSVAAVAAAAAEVGLPPAAVQQAIAELRAGVLSPEAEPAALDRAIVVEAAVVPVAVDAALAAIGKWLSDQTFHRHRAREGIEVWRLREDWAAGLQRGLDWSASVRLKQVRQVVVRAIEVEGGTLLRLECTVGNPAQVAPAIGASVAGTTGAAGTAVAAAALSPGWAAIGAGLTGMATVGGWLAGRNVRRSAHARVRDEVAAELDRIASGLDERNAVQRLRDRARGHQRREAWHRVSVVVEISALREATDRHGLVAYLVSLGESRPHLVSVELAWDGDGSVCTAGRSSTANAAARSAVTLLWPPGAEPGYSLIVDATASITDDGAIRLSPTSAVLHRLAATDVDGPTCRPVE